MTRPDISVLVGTTLRSVTSEPHSWHFVLSDGSSVRCECPWRLVAEARIAVTSEDHDQRFGLTQGVDAATRALTSIGARAISDARIATETGDLIIHFGTSTRVEVIVDSCGYESWHLTLADGRTLIATGGGDIAQSRGAV